MFDFNNTAPCEICGHVPPEGFHNSWGPLAMRRACDDCIARYEHNGALDVWQGGVRLEDLNAVSNGFLFQCVEEDSLPKPSEN
jgi:hypothetical protein